jgi:hypothetical protein
MGDASVRCRTLSNRKQKNVVFVATNATFLRIYFVWLEGKLQAYAGIVDVHIDIVWLQHINFVA